jgi:hypothetical protein
MKAVCFFETLVLAYESTQRHNPEGKHHLHRRENLKYHLLKKKLRESKRHAPSITAYHLSVRTTSQVADFWVVAPCRLV